MTYSSEVQLRDIPEAGAWAWWFAALSLACLGMAGWNLAVGDWFWAAAMLGIGLVNVREVDRELRGVSA